MDYSLKITEKFRTIHQEQPQETTFLQKVWQVVTKILNFLAFWRENPLNLTEREIMQGGCKPPRNTEPSPPLPDRNVRNITRESSPAQAAQEPIPTQFPQPAPIKKKKIH